MKSLVTSAQVTKLSWKQQTPRIIHADQDVIFADQLKHIEAIIDAIHEPILILDKQRLILSVNKVFLKKFKVTKKSLEGKKLFGNNENHPQAKKLLTRLKKLSRSRASFEELEITYPFRKIGERTLLVNAKQIPYDHKQSDIILLSVEDITQRPLRHRQKDD